ncbi:MAG TPA: hypothetical protein VH165_22510 [Kofleriaceae bacterium]|nr:hypothetical protein [Kofleriaceae bacterium]
MAVMPCPACQQPMNAQAVVCPHCNARRTDAAVGLKGKQLSPNEIRALVLTDDDIDPGSKGLISTLVYPHPGTTGPARTAELALTVVCLPFVVAGALSMAISYYLRRNQYRNSRGELIPVVYMTVFGGPTFVQLLGSLGVGLGLNLALMTASIVGLSVRGVIRARATEVARRALLDT